MIFSKLGRSLSRSARSRFPNGAIFGGYGARWSEVVGHSPRFGDGSGELGLLKGYLTSIGAGKDVRARSQLENWRLLPANPGFRRSFSSDPSNGKNCENYYPKDKKEIPEGGKNQKSESTEIVADLYQKMLQSVDEVRTMPPNSNLWSLVENCTNREDIKLLFQILQRLRVFRLSNLRIHQNFNCHLCMTVTKACARANAPDYGMKALWNHNVYGLTPSIASAHHLLLHAKEKNNRSLMVKIMEVLEENSLPLQPGTADIVFSICYSTNDWALMKKYTKRFLKAGVKLHRSAFDIWMEFAAKRGDAESIWKIDNLRSKAVKKDTLASGFSRAMGYLIEHNPESAAAAINLLYQELPDKKKALIPDYFQKLVAEWPKQVIRRQKKEVREVLAEALKNDISAMVASLLNMGIDAKVNVEEFRC